MRIRNISSGPLELVLRTVPGTPRRTVEPGHVIEVPDDVGEDACRLDDLWAQVKRTPKTTEG